MTANSGLDPEFNEPISKPSPRRRFRLIELLAVVGIIGLLIGLLLPARRTAGRAARRMQCASDLKQIALALHDYEQAYKALPPAYTVDVKGRPLHSWRTLILPYLDQGETLRDDRPFKALEQPGKRQCAGNLSFRLSLPRLTRAEEHDDLSGDRRAESLLPT